MALQVAIAAAVGGSARRGPGYMRNTFLTTLLDVAERDPRVWLLCGDLGYSVLEVFHQRFPDRFCNVGVAEQNMAGVASGLAHAGNTVFIYSIGNFPTFRCLEQL